MKKHASLFVMVCLFVFFLAAPGYTWQGRMAGMGDVYGLVEDESDYLTHPAAIANGKGVNYYFDARATYTDTTKWDYNITRTNLFSANSYSFEANGDEVYGKGLLGVAFPAGIGRAGIFFEYTGNVLRRGRYDGDENSYYNFDLKNDFENYTMRFLYGFPVGSVKLGAEFQIAYKDEEYRESLTEVGYWTENYIWGAHDPAYNLFPYMIPFNSQYWEAVGKISAEGSSGPVKYALTLKVGTPFASDNKYELIQGPSLSSYSAEMNGGSVEGYNFGVDFWFRYALMDNLSIPIVISAGYEEKKRDGSGFERYGRVFFDYENRAKKEFIELGGGVDYSPCKGAKIASGLYYDYLYSKQDFSFTEPEVASPYSYHYDYADFPKQAEHRLTLKVVGEREYNPHFSLRGGMNVFYGWITQSDYLSSRATAYAMNISSHTDNANSGTGNTFGINASIGATFKGGPVSFEPFVNGGYKMFDITGDGSISPSYFSDFDYKKDDWFVGAGFSIRF